MPSRPNVSGILETTLYVSNLKTSIHFYQQVFGFKTLLADERFCALSVANRQILLLFTESASRQPLVLPGGTIPEHGASGQLHVAFPIATEDLDAWRKWLLDLQVNIDSEVRSEYGGTSLYFRDPDIHLLEVLTPGCWPNH